MESGPMGLRQDRSREGSLSLNIRTGLSSWIRYWMQHSYTSEQSISFLPCLLLLLPLLLSFVTVPMPLVIQFANSIRRRKPKAIGVHPR